MGLNHVYKVIWNKTKGCYVVVSEIAKRVGRNKVKAAVVQTGTVAAVLAVTALTGSVAQAALNDPGTGNGIVAWGAESKANGNDSVAIGKGPTANGNYSVAIGSSTVAGNINAVAMGNQASATGDNATALGRAAKAERNDTVAVGNEAKASADNATAVGRAAKATQNSAVAVGDTAEATESDAVAIGKEAKATQARSIAIGQTAKVNGGQDTVAIGTNAQVNNHKAIALGRDSQATAEFSMALGAQSQATATRAIALGTDAKAQSDQAVAIGSEASAVEPRSIAIGKYARVINGQDTVVIGTDTEAQGHGSIIIGKNAKTKNDAQGTIVIGRDAFSEGSGNVDRPNTVIGRGAYTAFGQNADYRLNASTAIGFQAGAGVIRESNDNRKLVNNNTNADNNAEVLVKAGYALDRSAPADTKAAVQSGAVHNGLVFYRQNHINEGTAIGVESRAVGDQSIAIGGQVVAGDGVVALGGNDTDALRDNKYQVVTDNAVRNTNVSTVDDYNLAYTESERTVAGQYEKLVGRGMPTAYKSTYGQSGSVVIGMEAHSTTALGTAIGTNSVVRMGAFGATAIGAGSTVQPNAEAAVAIGMGSVANGAYALAAGTASWAELGDIAMGYKAKASGKQGAIAIGQSTNAKGDSSVMVGGANISNAADQATTYEAERKNPDGSRVTYTKNVTERINGQDVTRKYTYVSTERKNGKISDAYAELTGKTMNTSELDYNTDENKNGHASTSVGVHSLAKGDLASAYGASSRASAIGSLALGTGAIADKQNAVAIGTGSTTDLTGTRQLDASYDKDGKWVASDSPNAVYTFKWAGGLNTSEGDVVSFGSSGAERQLKNVAAGRIAEDSTDAINGSQVNAVIEKFIAEGVKYFSVNSTVEPNRQNKGATGTDAIAIGPSASATQTNALATGTNATATGESATAYGTGTKASETGAVAIGSTITKPDATKASTEATGANATALGAGAQATALDSTAVGALSEAKAAEAIAIGSKAKSESVAGVAIGQNAQVGAAATQGLALGQNTTVSTVGGVALGVGSVASVASGVSGIGVDGEAEGTARVNTYAKLHDNADNALTSGQGAVAIGGTSNNTPFTRQITGLAAGTNDTDAVNVAQLKSVNLAFKGNTGTGDVRLHDQRLTVESDNTDLLTVEASDKKLTLKPKTTALTVDSTAGSATLGKVTVPTTNALVTAQDVANAINAAHWNVATAADTTAVGAKHTGADTAAVHAGETVKFIAGEHVTIHQDGRNITVSMKDAVTNIMVKDQIAASFEDGNNTAFTVNPDTGKFRYDVSSTPTYTTITTGKTTVKDGAVSNLNDHLPKSDDPSVAKPNITSEGGTEAATVNDVLNAGWNLQNNGEARDFVKPYDTVNFVNGANTTAVVTTTDGTISKVTYNVTGLPVSYTTADGTPVSKVGDKYYTIDEKGNPVDPVDTTTNPLKSNLVNPNVTNTTTAPNTSTTTPTQLGNVANGAVTHNLLSEDGKELALAKDGNYYEATKVNPDGTPMTGVTQADAKTPVVLANDGKWYPKTQVNNRGDVIDKNTATPVIPPSIASAPTAGLIDFGKSNPNNAATVGDLQNMGWVVSASTGGYLDQVRNANQVDFVGKNGVTVTGETKNGIRTITVETAEEAVVFKGPDGSPLIKTDKGYFPADSVKIDGNYYPANTTKDPVTGNIVNNGNIATPLTPVDSADIVTSMNSSTPKTLNNVKNTLPNVNDETKTITTPDGQEQPNAGDVSNINRAPLTAAQAAELSNPKTADGQTNPNYKGSNAATVSDVLNAGWNLETNGKALDFVKPYDTVNFADGGNTTIVSSTDGTTSKIQVNVTGLPVSNTVTDAQGNQVPVTKVGNTYFPVKADGTPDIKRDGEGNPTNGYTVADDGNIYPSNQIDFIEQPDGRKTVTPRAGVNPTTINTNLANPNVTNGDPNTGVNTPTPLGNVANGANTYNPISTTGTPLKQAKDGKWYDATKVDDQGNTTPDAAAFEGTPAVLANDGKWYPSNQVDAKGTPKADAQPITNPLKNQALNNGLINFANSNPNHAATVGDLQNMGWIVGAPGNNYADQVRNANQVNFVGKNLATVTGETDGNGIRTITVDVQAQKVIETAHTPVVYTDSKGNKLTKLDNGKFYDAAEAKVLGDKVTEIDGKLYPADAVTIDGKLYPAGSVKGADNTITTPGGEVVSEIKGVEPVTDAKASMNNTEGSTTNPFPLANVGSNLKQVVDSTENTPGQVNDKDGETKVGDKTNTAPYTAKDAANLVQKYELNEDGTVKTEKVPVIDPKTGNPKLDETGQPVLEDKKVLNPNYIGNNAATVSDVLNTGWNLQNNGEARDFVKPYDTVNFVNGANTTAVVTTSEDGTTSKVTFNVTGLPVAYTDADGNKVAKIGDKYYKVNDKGQPLDEQGQPSKKVNDKGIPVNADGQEIPSVNVANTSLVNPTPQNGKTSTTSPTALKNVTSNLSNYTEPVKNALRNLDNENVSNNTAATVGDLRNMGWIVSSDKKTGELDKAYSEAVKNANEVKFVGTGAAVVSGKTADDGVRTITVSVDNQVATNNSVTPVVYTKADGTQVYPTNQKDDQGRPIFNTNPDGSGDPVPNADVVTSVNGPNGTKGESAPTTLKNVKNNIPNVNDGTQEITNPDGTVVAKTPDQANINKAPLTAAKAAELSNPKTADGAANPNYIGNNAATVSDVLNAGWNLQNNGTAKDFVKPFDTVNFVNGTNTTAVVTTAADGTTSDVTYNVTGLPITYTTADGKPVSKVGDKFYTVNEQGQPITEDGKPAVKRNADGQPVTEDGTVINPIDTTANPLQSNLVNPNTSNNQTTTPTQLGNVANGAKTFAPVDNKVLANDGKWYNAIDVNPNGAPKDNVTSVDKPATVGKEGLIDFTNSNPNNAATVGDLQNMGWVVSAQGNNYSDQVRNANEVKFVGEGTATVTGKTDENGVRTITVKVDDQVSTNNAVTPVVYTDKDGNTVYPIKDDKGNVTYHTTPDGKGKDDKVVPNGDVNTSVNGPKDENGNNRPASLGNVKNNIPTVNDEDKKAYNVDGTPIADKNNTAAPITAQDAADLLKPMKDGVANPKFVGNNAATVSDVLNAGWNLQNNGTAKDFVKPFDTVNFVNGTNTTAVVTTAADGTTSDVTYNVTGLPITYTTADGKPVSKVGDKFYTVNEQGQPITEDGKPAVKRNADGQPVTEDGTVINPIDTTANPLQSNLVNPNTSNNQTTTPTQLGNVANGAKTFAPVAADGTEATDAKPAVKLANDGKWYPADQVEPNGKPKENATPVANPLAPKNADGDVLEKGNDGKWYKAADLTNGKPADNAAEQTPVARPANAEKSGLIDFTNSNPNNAATVGDLQNMGWVVSAQGNNYSDQVRNANEVKFVGEGTATVTGKTDENGVRTITVKVDDQVSTNNAVTPVVYTDKDGNTVYPIKDDKGNVTYHTTPDGKGKDDKVVPNGDVNTSVNGPKDENGNNRPASLGNVKNNIPTVNDEDKKAYNVDGTPIADKNNTAAPITAQDAADLLKPMKDGVANPKFVGNNAATVSDVLNAGWNLQGNGKAVDFVKPYDTVNFRDGGNTTVTVTTDDNLTSHVQVNVTGLPVANTITDPTTGKQVPVVKVGDTFYPTNPDGTPNIQKDAATGEPTNGYVRADDGKFYPREDVDVTPAANPTKPATVTPKAGKTPTTVNTNLANPNVTNTTDNPGNNVNTPSQLGNVANGAKTFAPVAADGTEATDAKPAVKLANDGKWYPADQVEPNGKPKENATPVANPLAPKNADGDVLEKGNDGKWYKAADLTNGKPADNAAEQTPVARPANAEKSGLIDFTNSNPNNAATVGDLQNMGWVVSAQGNNYSDQVRNANEVKFVGEGTATVTGKTDENGVRTITVKVDDQVSTNNAVTPVVYTDKDGNTVYPIKDDKGNVTYHTTPDGKGQGDKVVPNGDVNTSINAPKDEKGNNRPASLGNVKNNIPNVNDGTQEITNPDGTVIAKTPDQANINKAPLTAADAAKLSNPKTADGATNPNYIGNNAATVSDVLNAGWNLQNNGAAKDFVKPFDTVNFVNGGNTTAVVTIAADGTTSDVTYNVTGLPITYTTADGKPVSKVGDKFYTVNEQGQPITADGKPAVTTNAEGKPVTKDGTVIEPINTTENPLQSNLVNPNVANTAGAPNNQTTTPTQLGNVANGANTFAPVDNKVLANDGKWYNATDVAPNGKPKDGVTPVDKPANVGKEGLIDFENSKPNNAATVGDLQNLGFVVSAKDNGYTDQVRNANKVEFKGTNGVEVTGKTLEDGTREITVGLKAGKVTNDVIVTKEDGTETHAVRGEDGKVYQKDPVTGKATTTEIPVGPKDTVKNDGDSFVNGNAVATAIEKSGWNVGIGSTDKAFSTEAKAFEKVNPNDNVKYVNGANTTVSMAVDAAEDKDGTTVTTTYVKVDVNRDLNIDSVTTGGPAKDKDGNPLKLVDGKYYPENALVQDGKAYPAGTTFIDGKPYPAGAVKDPKTNSVVKDGQPATEVEPLAATPKEQLANGKDGAMTVKDAQGKDGVSATAKDGKGTLTLNNAGTDKAGKDASKVDISTGKAPADLNDIPKDAVRANDGKWYAPADVTVKTENGKTVVTPVAGKSPIADAPTMDRIQYTGTDGKLRDVATMDDGLRFQGDDGESISKPLNSTVQLTGGNRSDTGKPVAKEATTTGNIGVFNTDGKLSVQLAKDLEKMSSANFESKTDNAGNPLKVVDGKYYPEKAVVKEGKVYPEGTVIIDNKPYPAGTTKDAAGKVVNNGKPATEATPINPIDKTQVQEGPTSKLTGTGLTFNTPTPKDETGKPLVLVDGKYYKADNLENGKPKADAKPEPVKPAQSTAFTPDGLVVTPETAKVRDANGNPIIDKNGREVVDPTKVVSFGSPTIVVDPNTGKPMVDANGNPVMKSGISAGGQVMANVAPGVLDTDGVNVSQLKGVSNMVVNVNNRMNRMGAQAAAMAGLRHLQYDPLEPTTIMAGIGTYKGEGALALGIAHYKNESTLFHAGASIGSRGDELMANAGVSWKFGARADETAVKDTFRQGPISASYTLQDKVSALEAQNQMQKDEINTLKAQLAEVLQYIKKG